MKELKHLYTFMTTYSTCDPSYVVSSPDPPRKIEKGSGNTYGNSGGSRNFERGERRSVRAKRGKFFFTCSFSDQEALS